MNLNIASLNISGSRSAGRFAWTIEGETFYSFRPAGGFLFEFDPNTDTVLDAYSVLATIVKTEGDGDYTITEPSGGYLRTFNPATATVGQFFDCVATLAYDLENGMQDWTVTEPDTDIFSFNPRVSTIARAYDFFATLLGVVTVEGAFTLTYGGQTVTYFNDIVTYTT